MSLCIDCQYPVGGEVATVDELPRSWRPPPGAWIPSGPRFHFRVCDACETPWAIRVDPESGAITVRELPLDAAQLFDERAPLEQRLRFIEDDERDAVRREALGALLSARLEHGAPAAPLEAFLDWLVAPGRRATPLRAALVFFGPLLERAITDPHLERAREQSPGLKRELFAARIDEGHGLNEAAKLAQRDWVSSNKVISLPTVRGLDVTRLVTLAESPPGDGAEREALRGELSRTLTVIATAALGTPMRLTVTETSKARLAAYDGGHHD